MSSNSLPCVPLDAQKHHKSFVPDDILRTKYVFVRHDAHRGPLQRPYDWPYEVISKRDKSFRGRIGNREEHFSIDRMKHAHLNSRKSTTSCSTSTAR